uniref:DZIP3-like HEPN domain-containing protein n=1 Tax=Clytia hemisphaerica TaxID=252671 RepID=A0A7M5VER8_9CNID
MNRSIEKLINDIQFWLRLATFLHEPIKLFLIWILHNLGNDPSYNGLPQNPQLLFQELSTPANQKKINRLKGKVLKQDQLDLLLPPNGNATDSSTFDVTLLCILIRNFTTIPAPMNGWSDKNPPAHDLSIAAFVIRAREWRNFVHHTDPDNITQAIFNQKWLEGEQIINNFGYTFPTAQLQTQSLDPSQDAVLKSLQQYINEIKKLKSQIKTIQKKPAGMNLLTLF